ncbi:MAG: ClbS/DfsB family four-helix bundle protein [Chloroflexota bacterium]|nr:ClbS/DfsB family four-helix bundle protein [Chloroflexota bacterium]
MDVQGPLDHLEAWQAFEQGIQERAFSGAHPAPPWPAGLDPERDQDRINRHVHDATRARPLPETLRTARATWDRLEERIAALPDEALIAPDHFPWLEGRTPRPAVARAPTAHLRRDHEVDVRPWLAGAAANRTAG